MEKVRFIIGTQMGREVGLKPLCRIHYGRSYPADRRDIAVLLNDDIDDWVRQHGMEYSLRIRSQWKVDLVIDDPRLAMMFKLTWM